MGKQHEALRKAAKAHRPHKGRGTRPPMTKAGPVTIRRADGTTETRDPIKRGTVPPEVWLPLPETEQKNARGALRRAERIRKDQRRAEDKARRKLDRAIVQMNNPIKAAPEWRPKAKDVSERVRADNEAVRRGLEHARARREDDSVQ